MVNEEKLNCREKKSGKGFISGLCCGLVPHLGCVLFIIFTVFGVTAASTFLKPLMLNRFLFHSLMAISLLFATVGAAIYLKKNGLLSPRGIAKKRGYLLILYGSVISINLLMFLVVFPYAANWEIDSLTTGALTAETRNTLAKLTLEVDIPCSGHAPLIIDELKKLRGIYEIKYRFLNFFDVRYDSSEISEKTILSLDIFRHFSAKII